MSAKYEVRLTIQTIDLSTGEPVVPGNTVTDATTVETPEAAMNVQYAYKALLGGIYIKAAEAGAENSDIVQAAI